jgi:chaperonin GroES
MKKRSINELLAWTELDNIATQLDDETLVKVGNHVKEVYLIDYNSMSEWRDQYEKGMKITQHVMGKKTTPWPGASNVHYPLIATAVLQFNARAYPEIVRDHTIVKTRVAGKKTQEKVEKAERVSQHMSYQLLHEDSEWEASLDKLLVVLSVCGTAFKKHYYDPLRGKNCSILRPPTCITINADAECLEKATVTDEIMLFKNDIHERIAAELFLDKDYMGDSAGAEPDDDPGELFLEQHCWFDLDNDGYKEPYVVTVHKDSGVVARIVARFEAADVRINEKAEIVKIDAFSHYTDYHFIPNFEGKFWSYGYIYLLLHTNSTINSLLNQLLDAGTLANSPGGVFGKGARLPGGRLQIRPGKWTQANASGVDIKNNIVPIPAKEPSMVLFNLLQFLIQGSEKLISMSEAMSGQVSGSNTTAAEALAVLEQGMKVLNAIYKRIFRQLRKEFKALFILNSRYLPDEVYFTILDDEAAVAKTDYDLRAVDVFPVADPVISSQVERLTKARAALEAGPAVGANMRVLGRMYLKALQFNQEDIDQIIPPQDPNQPSPEQQQMAEELQRYAESLQIQEKQLQQKDRELEIKEFDAETKRGAAITKGINDLAKAEAEEAGTQIAAYTAEQQAAQNRSNVGGQNDK